MTTYDDTANLIRNRDMKSFLEARGIPTNKVTACPFCGGGKNTPCATYYKKENRFHCFSCNGMFSILDFIAKENGLSLKGADYFKAVRIGAQMFGLPIPDETSGENQNHPTIERKQAQTINQNQGDTMSKETEARDYTEYFKECGARLTTPEAQAYLEKRGLSLEVCQRFGIGFDPNWKHPKASKAYPSPRLIIPNGKSAYLARDTREGLTKEQEQFSKMKVGELGYFNTDALASDKPIFVVEGEIDTLSIESLGYPTIGLGTLSRANATFANFVRQKNRDAFLLLALDWDKPKEGEDKGAGQKATERLCKELKTLGIRFKDVSQALYGEYKDANECLTNDRGHFEEALKEAYEHPQTEEDKSKLDAFLSNVQASQYVQELLSMHEKENAFFPTGFKRLDEMLDGGIYDSLYVLGATSSIGKTTLALQIADTVASQGQDVLIFSLEMPRTDLIGKSISRISFEKAMEKKQAPRYVAWSFREIVSSVRFKEHSKDASGKILHEAVLEYEEGAGAHILIIEGCGDTMATFPEKDSPQERDISQSVRHEIENYMTLTGKKPFVIIDYMQLLTPMNERASEKQNMDKSILELKRIVRDKHIPILAISSFNRSSYATGATMGSFKESGAIEYTADVLIGLSLTGMKDIDSNSTAKKAQNAENASKSDTDASGENVRDITLTILKNRHGITGRSIRFDYYPKYNWFRELTKEEENLREQAEINVEAQKTPKKGKQAK